MSGVLKKYFIHKREREKEKDREREKERERETKTVRERESIFKFLISFSKCLPWG